MKNALTTLLIAALVSATPAMAQEEASEDTFDPSALSLEDVITCLIDVPTYNGFVMWFHDNPDALKQYGLTPMHGGENPFLSEYRLAKPITVFGHTTNHIAFSSSALLAILSGVTPQKITDELDVDDGGDFMGKFLAQRILSEDPFEEKDLNLKGVRRIALNVSTVTSHPDRVLVGCSYRMEYDEESK
jgi:hypothetical protein